MVRGIVCGDCVELLPSLDDESVDLIFADPPFNIGYDYDGYEDRRDDSEYREWLTKWIGLCAAKLKRHGAMWVAMGDEFAADAHNALRLSGLHMRNWVIWYYTFGVNCSRKFNRSHTHLLYFTKHKTKFTFNKSAVAVPSERERRYGDKRASAAGKAPDNTWMLNPADFDSFDPSDDTWHFPRVCGTFKEREGWHGCQMPIPVMTRIIECCSNPGELVLDPFAGSGSTLAAAKGCGRDYLGFEISEKYAQLAQKRVTAQSEGVLIGTSKLKG